MKDLILLIARVQLFIVSKRVRSQTNTSRISLYKYIFDRNNAAFIQEMTNLSKVNLGLSCEWSFFPIPRISTNFILNDITAK